MNRHGLRRPVRIAMACVLTSSAYVATVNASAPQTVVAVTGTQAVGLPPGIIFNVFDSLPQINQLGEVSFASKIDGVGLLGPSPYGLWSGTPDSISLIAATGIPAPVQPVTPIFRRFQTWS